MSEIRERFDSLIAGFRQVLHFRRILLLDFGFRFQYRQNVHFADRINYSIYNKSQAVFPSVRTSSLTLEGPRVTEGENKFSLPL